MKVSWIFGCLSEFLFFIFVLCNDDWSLTFDEVPRVSWYKKLVPENVFQELRKLVLWFRFFNIQSISPTIPNFPPKKTASKNFHYEEKNTWKKGT
jgi:hypothetical protein